jgi:CheY-like chemotaxis protein
MSPPTTDNNPLSILVVEDNECVLNTVPSELRRLSIRGQSPQVQVCKNWKDAVIAMKEHHSLAIFDNKMPKRMPKNADNPETAYFGIKLAETAILVNGRIRRANEQEPLTEQKPLKHVIIWSSNPEQVLVEARKSSMKLPIDDTEISPHRPTGLISIVRKPREGEFFKPEDLHKFLRFVEKTLLLPPEQNQCLVASTRMTALNLNDLRR